MDRPLFLAGGAISRHCLSLPTHLSTTLGPVCIVASKLKGRPGLVPSKVAVQSLSESHGVIVQAAPYSEQLVGPALKLMNRVLVILSEISGGSPSDGYTQSKCYP